MSEKAPTKGSKLKRILGGSVGILGLASTGVLAIHATAQSEPVEYRHCTTVPELPENIPPEDIDEAAIQNGLQLRASQLHRVFKFAATCYVPEADELQFGKGEPIRADLYQYTLGLIYDKCIVYGAPTQLIPHYEDETRPAVVACIGPTTVEEI